MRASIPFLTLFASLACAVAASAQDCRRLLLGGVAPELTGPSPALATLVCHQAYEVLVSDQAREPLWSAERLSVTSGSPRRGHRYRASFRAELLVPPEVRAEPWDYGHGYDRGHMTPAADVPPGPARQETYSLANVVPQAARLNRGKWERIENGVRRLARRDGPLFVVTGPVIAPGDARTWDGSVEIPAATWKAVYDPARRLTFAWICSNTAAPTCGTSSLAGIEQVTGVDPFPALQPMTYRQISIAFPPRHRRRWAGRRTWLMWSDAGWAAR
jgi:endonuclease G